MATISRYETTQGRRYRVRFRTPDNRQTDKRGFRTKRDAEAFAATIEVSKLRGEFVDASRSKTTVQDLGETWLAHKTEVKPSTYRAIESSWRVHVQPRWGATPVSRVEYTAIQAWISELTGRGLSATTIKRALGVLSGILDDAVKDRRILTNPCRGVRTPRKVTKEHQYLTHEQLHRFANEAGQHRTFVLLLGYCGLRWGEAVGLRVRDIDLRRNRITVNQNAVEVGSELHIGTPKGHERRSVPFPAMLNPLIREACRDKLPDALVFARADGAYLRRSRTTRRAAAGSRAQSAGVASHE